jgi:hypothetical protein
MRERWAFLYQVIAQKPKCSSLREYDVLVLNRPVLEVKHHTARNAIAVDDLA